LRVADRRRAALASVITLVFVAIVVAVLGMVVDRARPFVSLAPDVQPLFAHAQDSSFPSDHTLISVALAAPVLLVAPRIGIPLLLLALVVGFARVAAGVHFATDVVGSAVIASLLAFPALFLAGRLIARLPARLQRLAGLQMARNYPRQERDSN
jgi:membrane-associated phospholipid phosphatase